MDDRQYALLARQPSAALQNRERFCGMPKRGLAFLLANVMFWQPMWAQAGGIVVSGSGTSLGQAGNGVPIVNIAKPNGSGLSHNQFKDYNVGSNGVILNNATSRTQSTQLGGIVLGNPNLNGAAATTILNEVNGGSPSQLRGYTEVAGQSAHVIVANPYGITCNGCGFINTPQATLTTGKPVVENGQLTRYQVDQGSITVEGAGLNATNVDRFEIITRSAKINAEIQARNLTIVTGRNDVDATSLDATARADDGSTKPQLAIDSSALGGMYAGAIKLVGTEAGVGVKLDGKMIASGGDIQLDANGHLSLADTSATGAVNVKAASADVQGAVYAASVNVHTSGALDVQQSIAARDQISLSSGGQLTNNGVIEAGVNADITRNVTGDVSLTAQNLNNSGKSVIASRNLTTHVTQTLNNQGGTLSAGQASTVEAGTLDNQNTGRVLSSKTLTVTADTLLNTQGVVSSDGHLTATVGQLNNHAGQIQSAQDMQLTVESLDNSQQGLLSSQAGLRVDGAQLNNAAGLLTAVGPVHLETSEVDNTGGRISSKSDLSANVAELTNQGGELVAQGPLTVNGQGLDNRNGGLVGATDALTLNVDAVDNRGGEISSSLGIDIDGLRLNNSDNGKVLAGTDLGLKVAAIINQTKGLLFSTGTSTVTGQSLDNSGGSLVAHQGLDIRLDNALSNVAGLISSEGTLTAKAGSLDNTQGSISSAGALGLQLDNALLNQGGELVTDAGLTVKSASLDNRNNGTISGKQAVRVETGAFDNSQSGRLSSATSLDLSTQKLTNQDGGRIASNGALTASVTGLDQQGGQLFSNTALTLDLNQGQLNNQGGLINAPLLMLKHLAGVNNDGGEISSAQAFTLAAQSLDNDNGKLLSNQALTLRIDNALTNLKGLIAAAALDVEAASLNNNGGTLTSRANLDLALSGQLDNQSNGLINATDALTIHTSGLNNQQGSLLGSAIAVDFGATTGDLNNSAGLITTAGVLSLKHLRDLNNQNGEISSSQSLDLNTRDLDNSAGQLISNGVLTLGARDVINQGGLLSGFKGLGLTAASLDNRNSGTLSSRDEDLSATLSGALLNGNAGALVGKKQLTVSAASLDNGGGILSSGGDQTLTVTGGVLSNAQGGLIDSGNALVINAMTLGNAGGTVNAQNALSVTGTTLDNTGGQLIGNAAVTLDLLGALTNTNGKLASVGPLRVDRATQITNQGGQIASQGLLTLLTAGLDNRNRGTVAANDQLILTSTGTVQNDADGLIYSQNGGVQIDAASLTNGKGTVQSQGAMTLTVANDLDNQSGRLQAKAGDLMVVARNLDNRGGVLASLQGLLTTQLSGVLKNGYDLNNNRQGGITQAQRLNLIALGGLDNYGGRLSAQTGDASVTTRNFDNRNGGLYAKGKISVTANDFDNSGDNDGQIAGSQIDLDLTGALNNRLGIIESDSTLAIKAASLDNQTGQLRALGAGGKTEFQIGGLFDNRNGTLETANSDLTLGAASFLNTGGSLLHVGTGLFDISSANVIGAGGTLVTRGGLTINIDTWRNSGVIQAGRLNVNVNNFTQTASGQLLASDSFTGSGVNWFNEGLLASNGSMNIGLSGAYWGAGRLSSQGTLGLGAAQVSLNSVSSSIAGGGNTTVNVSGQLDSAGRLTSAANLVVNAAGVNNFGTLGSGQGLTVTTGLLVNNQGLIFSGADMGLRVDTLNNLDANIYSLGNLTVDRNGQGALASSILNRSGSIQSDGSMSLAASTIQNIRTLLTVGNAGIYTAKIYEIACIEGYNAFDCGGGKENHVWEILQREKTEVTAASAASSITAGGDLTLRGGDLSNQSSTIASGGSLTASLVNLTNSGIETGETQTTRVFRSERTRSPGSWYSAASNFTNKYWFESAGYDANDLSGLEAGMAHFIGTTEAEYSRFGTTTQIASGDQSYAAVIQAGGAVNISTQNNIDNSVVRPGYSYVGSGPRTSTAAAGSQYSTRITLNQQLPPNLAQQQVNPVALPGFSLPTGQNGLFRLSGQDGSAPASSGPQSWTLGTASLTPAPSQQTLPTGQASTFDTSTTAAGTLPGRSADFTLNRVQGLPTRTVAANPHKYLIETNPVLTDLKSFMSSDYLLQNLGYDPDQSAKRLGDGLYEQTLIQQAVVARTGQRFIDGQTSNEDMFKYLMNNAIASKQELNLSLGVSLSSEQVAALTHDIVWMENAEVNGEQVLVPVLYLANANNRLAANGALIQGSDVTLIAGKDLNNAGTLRASNNLSAKATNDLVNSGLVEAGNRVDLLADNNLVNKAGGIIAGRDVSLTATRGDVINERTVTTHESDSGYRSERTDFIDSAARIEAANNLTLNAGRDINNVGGVLKSGADTTLSATRDVNLTSAERIASGTRGLHRDEDIKQYGSSLDIGRDLTAKAGRDLTAVASQIDAKRDISLSAIGDLTLASAADEQHSYGKTKKVTAQEDHVSQVSTSVTAGGNVMLSAGKDLGLIASKVNAGDEAYLVAGANLVLQSAEDSDYSFYSKTKKSSSGKKFRLDETSSVTNVSSMVTSGSNSILVAGQDLLIKGSGVVADKGNAQLVAGNDVQILAVTDSDSARHERSSSKSSWGGLKSSKIKDQVSETRITAVGSMVSGDAVDIVAGRDVAVKGSSLVSTNDLTVDAARDLSIEAAQNTFQRDELHKAKGRDLTGLLTGNNGGLDDITGNMHLSINGQKHNGNAQETTLTASTIGSSNGNVLLTAGRGLKVIASDLVSTKDMSLRGSDVSILAGTETANQTSKDSSSSLAVGRVVGGIVIDTVNSIRNDVRAAQEADDGRLKAVKGAQALLSTYNAVAGLGGGSAQESEGRPANSGGSLIKIGTELGATRSKSSSEYSSETVRQSSLTSGSSLAIVATGDSFGSEGDIHVVGSKLKANETLLQANNAITLESAQNRKQWDNQNSHNKTSIGASFNIGEQNGFTLDLGAQVAKGMGTGGEITQVNSTVDTGLLMLKSGQDTTLAGAQVHADTVKAEVGGSLNITSRQDEASQKSEQKSGGVGASICVPPFCYGATVTATGNFAAGNTNSDYKAVTDQSGLYVGTGGYDIHVGGVTQLKGAVIASEATAAKNYLSTDRLVVSDIKNTSSIDSQSVGLSLSYVSGTQPQLGGAVPLLLGESDHSKTRSAVSEGSITVRNAAGANDLVGLNRDTANANQHLDRPDEKAMQERIDLIQSTVQLAGSAIDAYAQSKYNAATEQADKARTPEEVSAAKRAMADAASWNVGGNKRIMADIASGLLAAGLGGAGGATTVGIVANTTASDTFKKIGDFADTQRRNATDAVSQAAWAEGGAARVLLHALAGAAMGLSSGSAQSGAIGAGAAAALMPAIAAALEKSGVAETDQAALTTIIATGLGSAVGATGGAAGVVAGANAAHDVELFNRKLHKEQEIPLLEKKAQELEAERGKPQSSALWEDLLLIAAGTQVDAVDQKRLQGILQHTNSNDPESAAFVQDLAVAYDEIAKLAAQKIPLTWSDGRQIIADGAPVYAFNATDEQFNDSTLFNAAGTYGPGAVYERWRQYGESQTSQYSGEISNAGTYDSKVADAAERLSVLAEKGVQSSSIIDDAILSLTGLRGGKVVIDAVLEVIAARQLAKKTAADLAQRIANIRATLPSKLKGDGNMAVADIKVDGLPSQMAAHSRINNPTSAQQAQGIVGEGSGLFQTQSVPNNSGVLIPRSGDSEAKILEALAQKLGDNYSAKGSVTIFTERPACSSCLGVVEQFKARYPNIKVDVLDNKGMVMRPVKVRQ